MSRYFVQLSADEEVLGLIRRSPLHEWFSIIFFLIWILVPFFFFFPLMRLGLFGVVFFFLLIGSGLYYGLRKAKIWHNTVFIITDQKIYDVDQLGFRKRHVAELRYEEMSNVSAKKKSFFGKMFDIGLVRVQTIKALSYDLEIKGIKHPMHVAELINEVQYISERGSSDAFHAAKKKQS